MDFDRESPMHLLETFGILGKLCINIFSNVLMCFWEDTDLRPGYKIINQQFFLDTVPLELKRSSNLSVWLENLDGFERELNLED